MLTLRQLRYFDALARQKHFRHAAEHCSVTQPALSTQIQDLERELGVELVERRYKNVQLTAAGEEVARRASRILAEVRDLGEYVKTRMGRLTGALRLGVIPTVAPYLLPPLLPHLRQAYPGLDLHIRETQTHTLIDELIEGALDVLLLALPVEHADVECVPLFEDRFLLAMPADYDAGSQVEATPQLIANDRLLLLEEGHCLRDQALSFCQLRPVEGLNTFGTSTLSTIVQMVSNGYGLTLLPEMSIDVETRASNVKLMRFKEPQPTRTIGLAWRSTSPLKDDFQALGRLICKAHGTT
ncbi:MAG TPA: hydrogen peroxide-inducible genes activator [Hyphomicrobiales bacterium]|nr:hydrogen peroxide-inducible genes activator [Hyphomicrobiales bacterium]